MWEKVLKRSSLTLRSRMQKITKAKNGNGIVKKVAVKSHHTVTPDLNGSKGLPACLLHVLHVCDRKQAAKTSTEHLILREVIAVRSPAGLATYTHTNTVFCLELNPLVQINNMKEPFSKNNNQ